MRLFIALVVMLSLVFADPGSELQPKVELSAEELELEKCDPSPCPPEDEEPTPKFEDAKEVVLTAEENMEISQLDANETDTENALVDYYKWSGWLNKFDGRVTWCARCKRVAMCGMYSVHKNRYEDRRFQYLMRTWPKGMLTRYQWWTGYTRFGATWNIHNARAVIVTINSFHNNRKEDRRFRFLFRKINLAKWRRKSWRWTGLNKYDGVQSKNCGTGWVMGLWSRRSNYHKDRQFNVLCGWIVPRTKRTARPTRKPTRTGATTVTKTRSVSKTTSQTNSRSVTNKK